MNHSPRVANQIDCDMDAVGETQSTGRTLVDGDMDAVDEP